MSDEAPPEIYLRAWRYIRADLVERNAAEARALADEMERIIKIAGFQPWPSFVDPAINQVLAFLRKLAGEGS